MWLCQMHSSGVWAKTSQPWRFWPGLNCKIFFFSSLSKSVCRFQPEWLLCQDWGDKKKWRICESPNVEIGYHVLQALGMKQSRISCAAALREEIPIRHQLFRAWLLFPALHCFTGTGTGSGATLLQQALGAVIKSLGWACVHGHALVSRFTWTITKPHLMPLCVSLHLNLLLLAKWYKIARDFCLRKTAQKRKNEFPHTCWYRRPWLDLDLAWRKQD